MGSKVYPPLLLYIFLPCFALIHGGRPSPANSRKKHSQSALYLLFPKTILKAESINYFQKTFSKCHLLIIPKNILKVPTPHVIAALDAITELCCFFCLFCPPDKLPPHLILGDFPRVRFEVLRGFVKTSDGKLPDKLQFYPRLLDNKNRENGLTTLAHTPMIFPDTPPRPY